MRTFGVDLASQDALTAGCILDWDPTPSVVELHRPLSDDVIVQVATDPRTDVTAIDAPFGWPRDFAAAIQSYAAGNPFPPGGSLWLRETDHAVRTTTSRRPLSVSSDRIAYPAVRAARLLTRLGGKRPAGRNGADNVIEVYPAAALIVWGLSPGQYKRPDARDVRLSLIEAIEALIPSLEVGAVRDLLVASDHMVDAFIAALVGRAFALGRVRSIPEPLRAQAALEGWIWLPDGPLGELVDG